MPLIPFRAPRPPRQPAAGIVAATLFAVLFAAQAGVVVLTPIVPDIAADLGVSVGSAGRLRVWSALVAGLGALALTRLQPRVRPGDLLAIGLMLLATGSAASAAAPSLPLLAAAQAVLGAGLAVLLTGGVTAAAEWSPPDRRGHTLSWAFAGPPMAWIAGLPLAALAAHGSWRMAWIAVPLTSSLVALGAVIALRGAGRATPAAEPRPSSGRHSGVLVWAAGESLMFAAWGGTLVYVGALLRESYGLSVSGTGLALGAAAVAYLPGTFLARRWADASGRRLTAVTSVCAAALVAVMGAVRPGPVISVAFFAALALVAAGRTFAGGLRAVEHAAEGDGAAAGARAAAMQIGYLLGAGVGALVIEEGGYTAMGAAFSALFLVSLVPQMVADRKRKDAARRMAHPAGLTAAAEPAK
jgi:MFS transporter, DHA1 family, inner membrane transport protein